MAGLWIPRPTQQPPVGARVNWTHPLAHDLRSFAVFAPYGTYDAVDGVKFDARGASATDVNVSTSSGTAKPAAATYVNRPHVPRLQPTQDMTMAVCFFDNGTSAMNGFLGGKVFGNWNFHLLLSHGSQTCSVDVRQSNGTRYSAAHPGLAGGIDYYHGRFITFCGRLRGTELIAWDDIRGVVGINTSGPGGIAGTTDPLAWGDRGGNTPSSVFPGHIVWGALWGRALPTAEMSWMASEPYAFLTR